jgi:hypothetical protein
VILWSYSWAFRRESTRRVLDVESRIEERSITSLTGDSQFLRESGLERFMVSLRDAPPIDLGFIPPPSVD